MFERAGQIARDVLKRVPDPRHAAVRKVIAECYLEAVGEVVPWDGHTARTLATFLQANKTWSADALSQCVRNRFASENINPAEDPIRWIRRLPNYVRGPLDRFNKPKARQRASQADAIRAYWKSQRDRIEREAAERLKGEV